MVRRELFEMVGVVNDKDLMIDIVKAYIRIERNERELYGESNEFVSLDILVDELEEILYTLKLIQEVERIGGNK